MHYILESFRLAVDQHKRVYQKYPAIHLDNLTFGLQDTSKFSSLIVG